jgi:periplasmic divalent cation tolerance protein
LCNRGCTSHRARLGDAVAALPVPMRDRGHRFLPVASRRRRELTTISASAACPDPSADRAGPATLGAVTEYLQVATATETRDAALALAESAVAARLAGNAQVVGPVTSVFWHLGEQGQGEEWRLLLYTTADRYAALETHLLDRHPWTNPQVTATPIVAGARACLEWLRQSVADASTTP